MTTALAAPSPSVIDRLNAARALLGCVQIEQIGSSDRNSSTRKDTNMVNESHVSFTSSMGQITNAALTHQINSSYSGSQAASPSTNKIEVSILSENAGNNYNSNSQGQEKQDWQKALLDLKQAHDKKKGLTTSSSNRSSCLDALAMLAFSATVADNTNSGGMDTEDFSEQRGSRARSVSCPEGMERWNRYSPPRQFRNPSISTIQEDQGYSINDNDMVDNRQHYNSNDNAELDPDTSNFKKRAKNTESFDVDDLNSVALSICSFANRTESRRPTRTPSNSFGSLTMMNEELSNPTSPPSSATQTPVVESPTELLRKTRARLLEDLHESNGNEKGVMNMPHMLHKYKEMYNKNGRIGIYTPNERSAIIAKFNSKRTRRVWNKKIRYNCRKNLADRRVRVKGRFVKRSSEEAAAAAAVKKANEVAKKNGTGNVSAAIDEKVIEKNSNMTPLGSVQMSTSNSPSPSPTPGSLPTVSESEATDNTDDAMDHELSSSNDIEMDDKEKEEAGYLEPTEDQPFRRTRRYTIT